MDSKVKKDLTGSVFGNLTVLGPLPERHWLCQCECGKRSTPRADFLTANRTQSCGCTRYRVHHKLSKTRLYNNWAHMIRRCHAPKSRHYHMYGARGIAVCERWRESFEAFLEDMGKPGPGETLDRIDNSLGYFKENCRWASKSVQSQNRSITKLTPTAVKAIRILGVMGFSESTIAMHFSVTRAPVHRILRRQAWSNV